ncbi:extracellular solute-binding protein [Lachnospiraceae bacterium]|jgi:multiple sugar transport system substrate-binding protein|nr:extracellular solute-binding protein [uncultured Schaedlerella sp.]EOS34537.1 hypothetical protein C808_05184 [Lachnospiraceae bacterium M18-1]MCI9154943.1 extracellular solute-binding protein [Ruminococcus sp.]NBI57686.1 extracellular solute-binding protein [Lachnospiraceae bacterium]
MKKMLALLLAACLSVSYTACGGEDGSSAGGGREKEGTSGSTEGNTAYGPEDGASDDGTSQSGNGQTEISLWTYPVGNWGNSVVVAGLISDFMQQYPQIQISVKYLDYATGDEEVREAVEAGEAPDLVLEGPERLIADWGDKGLMADLTDLWEEDKMSDRVYENVRRACRHRNGKYYEYPICMTAHCMAINYDMFEAAGALQYIDEENHTWTTDGFIKAVKALKDYGQEKAGIIYCGGQGGDQGTRALVNNLYGGTFTDPEHTEYTINSEENIRALELLQGLEGIFFEPDLVGQDEVAMFCSGELAMAFCWNVSLEASQAAMYPEREFDIFPMAFPTSDGIPSLQGGIWGFGIFDNGDEARMEAARTFIKFMTESEKEYIKSVQTALYWPVRDMEDVYVNDDIMREYSIFTKYMGDYYQITPGWVQARTAWWRMLQEVGKGKPVNLAVEDFVKTADEAAEAALQ